jgi:hypothetical protein
MAVGRGYQPADFTPVSQFVPLPLDFLQRQLESTQKRQDTAMAEADAVGSLVSSIDPRLQDVGYAKQIQEEYTKQLEPFTSGKDLTSSATISGIRQLKNKFAQDERLKTLAHNKEQQKLYDKLHSEGKLVGAILPEGDDFSYDANNIQGKSVDLGKLLYFQDWQTPITNQLKLVEEEITKSNPGASIKTIQDEQGNWVRVLEKPGQKTVKLKDDNTFRAAVDSITTEALQASTPYSIYMNELANTKGKDPKAEVRSMIERLSIPMHKREETTDTGSMQVITSSDELAKEGRVAAKAGKTENEVVNPNYAPVTSAYNVGALNKNLVKDNKAIKNWTEFKTDADLVDQAFNKVSEGDLTPMKDFLFKGLDDSDKRYIAMTDVDYKIDADDNYIPNVNLTKETLAKNKLISDNEDKKGTQEYIPKYVPSNQDIINEAAIISDDDLFNIDNTIDSNINSINNYRKANTTVLTNAKNKLHKTLGENELVAVNPDRNPAYYTKVKQYAMANAIDAMTGHHQRIGDNPDLFEFRKSFTPELKKEYDFLKSQLTEDSNGDYYFNTAIMARTEKFLRNAEKETKNELNLVQPAIDQKLAFNRNDYNKKLEAIAAEEFNNVVTQAERVPVISWSREGQTRKENQESTIIGFENEVRDNIGFETIKEDGNTIYRPKNLQALSTLDNITVIDNTLDVGYELGQDITKENIFSPKEKGVFGASEKDTDEYYTGIQYQGVSHIGDQWRTVGNLVKADGTVGALVSFQRQGENTSRKVYEGLGIGDVSSVINTVDYVVDNSRESNKGKTNSIIPGVTMDITRKPVLTDKSKSTYRIKYDFAPEKIQALEEQLRAKKVPEDRIGGIIQNITNPKKEFANKIEMGLELQNLIQIFNDPSLGK